ncbi:MAG: type II toxin-antitoxin system VapC family toxin [Rhodocyclaceae bacterium]|nr:type II toxin-antitoxin system VapC family toxin [Rhodocyclaceae bacterium]MBX3667879.1 type II toxin-antitoxin system VapC family toxin [Rhodocyclaceae bacterium]
MKRRMLDTNTVSLLLKGHAAVTRQIVQVPMSSLCMSAISAGELMFGLARRPDATRLQGAVEQLLKRVDVLAWDAACTPIYGSTRAALESQGKPLGPLDMLIAAHALQSDSVLVSNDQAFTRVPGLAVEDWSL